MMDLDIPRKLFPFFEKPKRYKVAYGGRGAAKSVTFAQILAYKGQVEGAMIGCLREYQNSLDDSVYALISEQIRTKEIPGYKILKNRIDHKSSGGGMRFRGLARSIDAIKSMFGFKYFWLEEGQFISEDSLKILTPTLRESGSELWISANPNSSADPFSQRFIMPYKTELDTNGFYEDDMHYIVKINYEDNPWFPQVLEDERLHDYKYLPRALYDHIWLGAFNDSVENAIIRAEWFDAAIDAHVKLGFEPTGATVVAFDPSDDDGDDKGLSIRKGNVLLDVQSSAFGDVTDGLNWALDTAIRERADLFVWDCDGMGLGLKGQVERALKGKKIEFKMFKGSEGPQFPKQIYKPLLQTSRANRQDRTNRDTFRNRRAQRYWQLRDRLYATYLAVEKGKYIDPDEMLSISSGIANLKQLRSEICRIPQKHNATGKFQVLDKKEMRKLKIMSPNMSDSTMMSLEVPELLDMDGTPLQFEHMY